MISWWKITIWYPKWYISCISDVWQTRFNCLCMPQCSVRCPTGSNESFLYCSVFFFVFIRLSTSFHMWVCHGNFQTCKLWITRHASNFTCLYRNTLPFGMKNFNFIQWIYILLFNVAKESSLVEKRTITKSALNIIHDDNSMFEYYLNTIIHMQL